jgi:hypothetical protein
MAASPDRIVQWQRAPSCTVAAGPCRLLAPSHAALWLSGALIRLWLVQWLFSICEAVLLAVAWMLIGAINVGRLYYCMYLLSYC